MLPAASLTVHQSLTVHPSRARRRVTAMRRLLAVLFLLGGATATGLWPGSVAAETCKSGVCVSMAPDKKQGHVGVERSSKLPGTTHYNLRIERLKQLELRYYSFILRPGERKFSVQACRRGALFQKSTCTPWAAFAYADPPSPQTTGTSGGAQSSQPEPAKAPTKILGKKKNLFGVWDTQTSDQVKYTLTLASQGGKATGFVGAADPRLDGTMQVSLSKDGKEMSFVLNQPKAGLVSRGQVSLSASGDSFSGRITKDSEGVPKTWTGTRRK